VQRAGVALAPSLGAGFCPQAYCRPATARLTMASRNSPTTLAVRAACHFGRGGAGGVAGWGFRAMDIISDSRGLQRIGTRKQATLRYVPNFVKSLKKSHFVLSNCRSTYVRMPPWW